MLDAANSWEPDGQANPMMLARHIVSLNLDIERLQCDK